MSNSRCFEELKVQAVNQVVDKPPSFDPEPLRYLSFCYQVVKQPLTEAPRKRVVLTVTMGQQSPVRAANGFLDQGLQQPIGKCLSTQ